MSLKDINLSNEYRTDTADIVNDFYIPSFEVSNEYYRAVGYFTSHGLSLAAKGLATFLQHGGLMRLVASPLLNAEDIVALSTGYHARNDIIERSILRQLSEEFIEGLNETSRFRLAV